jgi:hypothetical protein
VSRFSLELLPGLLAICRLPADAPWPDWAVGSPLASVTRSADELSVICPQERAPRGIRRSDGWRALRAVGPMDLNLVGVLSSLLEPLTAAGVTVFALSTYDTDYLLVRQDQVAAARVALDRAGHQVAEKA